MIIPITNTSASSEMPENISVSSVGRIASNETATTDANEITPNIPIKASAICFPCSAN